MSTVEAKVADFLAQKRIAVAGVSRAKPSPANLIYNKLKGAGYQVFADNPNAATSKAIRAIRISSQSQAESMALSSSRAPS